MARLRNRDVTGVGVSTRGTASPGPGSQAAAVHSLSLRLSGEGRGTVKAKAPLAPLGGSPVRVMSMKLYIFLSSLKADERMRVNLSCSLLLVLSYSTINK